MLIKDYSIMLIISITFMALLLPVNSKFYVLETDKKPTGKTGNKESSKTIHHYGDTEGLKRTDEIGNSDWREFPECVARGEENIMEIEDCECGKEFCKKGDLCHNSSGKCQAPQQEFSECVARGEENIMEIEDCECGKEFCKKGDLCHNSSGKCQSPQQGTTEGTKPTNWSVPTEKPDLPDCYAERFVIEVRDCMCGQEICYKGDLCLDRRPPFQDKIECRHLDHPNCIDIRDDMDCWCGLEFCAKGNLCHDRPCEHIDTTEGTKTTDWSVTAVEPDTTEGTKTIDWSVTAVEPDTTEGTKTTDWSVTAVEPDLPDCKIHGKRWIPQYEKCMCGKEICNIGDLCHELSPQLHYRCEHDGIDLPNCYAAKNIIEPVDCMCGLQICNEGDLCHARVSPIDNKCKKIDVPDCDKKIIEAKGEQMMDCMCDIIICNKGQQCDDEMATCDFDKKDQSCKTYSDCYKNGKLCDGIADAGCICKNKKCKFSHQCGQWGAERFHPCSTCSTEDCEDEGNCIVQGGNCVPAISKTDVIKEEEGSAEEGLQ